MNILASIYAGSLFAGTMAVISGGEAMRGAELDPFFIFAIAAVLLLGEGFFSGSKGKSKRRPSSLELND